MGSTGEFVSSLEVDSSHRSQVAPPSVEEKLLGRQEFREGLRFAPRARRKTGPPRPFRSHPQTSTYAHTVSCPLNPIYLQQVRSPVPCISASLQQQPGEPVHPPPPPALPSCSSALQPADRVHEFSLRTNPLSLWDGKQTEDKTGAVLHRSPWALVRTLLHSSVSSLPLSGNDIHPGVAPGIAEERPTLSSAV